MAPSKISSITKAGIVRGAVGNADGPAHGPAHEGLFPPDALLELLSFLPHQEVSNIRENPPHPRVMSLVISHE